MLVFDLTSRPSFLAVESWVKDIDKNADKKVAKILVGNKADLAESEPGRRAVTEDDARKVANAHGMTYIETSAKSGANVEAAFERLAGLALESLKRLHFLNSIVSWPAAATAAAKERSLCQCHLGLLLRGCLHCGLRGGGVLGLHLLDHLLL